MLEQLCQASLGYTPASNLAQGADADGASFLELNNELSSM